MRVEPKPKLAAEGFASPSCKGDRRRNARQVKALAARDSSSAPTSGRTRRCCYNGVARVQRGIMAAEFEGKFRFRSEAWRSLASSEARIRQGYLASGERSTTRVRIKNGT